MGCNAEGLGLGREGQAKAGLGVPGRPHHAKEMVLDQEACQSIFEYKDGALHWRHDRGSNAKAGRRAGRLLKTGYRTVQVSGRRYQEHRLIFLWWHGVLPAQIDHVNGQKADNRIENLREATHSQNQANTPARKSESGFRGVRFVAKTSRWAARIFYKGREIRIGTFATAELASEAYQRKAVELFGEFVRQRRPLSSMRA